MVVHITHAMHMHAERVFSIANDGSVISAALMVDDSFFAAHILTWKGGTCEVKDTLDLPNTRHILLSGNGKRLLSLGNDNSIYLHEMG